MHLLKIRQQLSHLHSLIQIQATGTPEQLAQRMGVTDRTVKSLIAQLRQLDADICYCHRRRTYYYRFPVCFKFGFELLDDDGKDDSNTKNGGGVNHS